MKTVRAIAIVLLVHTAAPATTLRAQTLELDLDRGSLAGNVGEQMLEAELGPGARFIAALEGQGVEPGERGPAIVAPVPDGLWRPSGTLAFRFRVLVRYHSFRVWKLE